MIARWLQTYVFLLISMTLMSQVDNNKEVYYGRYEGVVDSTIQITANIVRLFDNVSGNYYYTEIDDSGARVAGNSFQVQGEVSDNIAELKEYGNNGNIISGLISKESFVGTWKTPGNNQIEIDISESYPEGTIPFDVHYLHSEDLLDRNLENSPVAEIELTLIYPVANNEKDIITDSICRIITNSFFGTNFQPANADSMLTDFENEYYVNYRDQNADRLDNGASFSWQKIVSMSVYHNSDFVLCIEYLKYAYSGGAHGMTNISYDNINLKDGNQFAYEDVFLEGTKDSLTKLLTQKLYEDKKIPSNMSLKEAGYFVKSIAPNHNFFINNNGIGFLYNSYEIAPYSYGQTRIFLKFNQIERLLVPDSPIYKLNKKSLSQK